MAHAYGYGGRPVASSYHRFPSASGPLYMTAQGVPVPGQFHRGGIVSGGIDPGEPVEPIELEKPDPDRAPDLIGEIIGWRAWQVSPTGDLGASAMSGSMWHRGRNHAICTAGHHTDVPAEQCTCGYYGWHEPESIQHAGIVGAFKAWGEIIVHDCGIRAEYAEIVVLVDADSYLANPILAAAINERYGVPIVKTVEEAKKIAYEVGREVPKELRPELAEREDEVAQLRSQYRAHSASVQQMSNAMQRMAGSMQSTKVATTTNPFWTGTITEATREYTPSFGTRFAREFDRLEDFVLAQSPPIGFPMFMALLMTFPIWLPLMALVALVHNPKP